MAKIKEKEVKDRGTRLPGSALEAISDGHVEGEIKGKVKSMTGAELANPA